MGRYAVTMTPIERFRGTAYFPALDGLRAIAALAVVGLHAHVPGDRLFVNGAYGVDLFFAISGFLITTLLLRESEKTGTISLRGFYARRSARIFPLYYAVLALYCVLVAFTQHNEAGAAFWRNLPAFLTYTTQIFVRPGGDGERVIFYIAWSLAVEEQFYLAWPWLLRKARGAMWLGVAATLSVALVPHVAALGLGCLLAMLLQHPRTGPVIAQALHVPGVLPILMAAVLVQVSVNIPVPVIGALIATLCVGAAVVRPPWWLNNPVMHHLGVVSYGIYMLHQLSLNAVRSILHLQGYDLVVVGAIVATAAATVSYLFFETPLREKLRDLLTAPRAVSAELGHSSS